MADATLKEIVAYFGYKSLSEFKADWSKMTETDREQIKVGIGNGTETY